MQARKALSVILALVPIALMPVGFKLYEKYAEKQKVLSAESLKWPSVDGVIVQSRRITRRNVSGGSPRKDVVIKYKYTVSGRDYLSRIVRFDQGKLGRRDKERLLEQYPEGKQVTVYYKPEDPAMSVLVPGSWR